MTKSRFNTVFREKKPLIGMVHLSSLPGHASYGGMGVLVDKALTELKILEAAGYAGALVENTDIPGFVGASLQTKRAMEEVVKKLVKHSLIPVGVEIIYDMPATIEVAYNASAKFVRLDVFVDDVETRWGVVQSEAGKIQKMRGELGNGKLVMLTDIHVKHTKLISRKTLKQSTLEAVKYGSDAVIVTGDWTGVEPDIGEIKLVKSVLKDDLPVLMGSGLSIDNVEKLFAIADGGIVGTSIKSGGQLDYLKARELVDKVKTIVGG